MTNFFKFFKIENEITLCITKFCNLICNLLRFEWCTMVAETLFLTLLFKSMMADIGAPTNQIQER